MKRPCFVNVSLMATILMLTPVWLGRAQAPATSDTGPYLWQLGTPDHNDAEFALAPDKYNSFTSDGFFVVGESDVAKDWPYVQPGPDDNWAGSRQHAYTVVFALKTPPAAGDCTLHVNLVDTHSYGPPHLQILVNGRAFDRTMPNGAGDASLEGKPADGKPYDFTITFPADLLRPGNNNIQITSVRGSWMVYDWVGLATPPGATLEPVTLHTTVLDVKPVRALIERDGQLKEPILVNVRQFGATAGEVSVRVADEPAQTFPVHSGEQQLEVLTASVAAPTTRKLVVSAGNEILAERDVELKPVRQMTVYMLPHSHTDIGYTTIQSEVEKKQVNNLLEGIAAARRTADYPPGARFVWNVEVLWAADLYLHRMNDQQRAEFFEAVQKGWVVLNGMYLNELTGLCRPEELIQLFRGATEIADQTGVPIQSAMISDVPGYTWGTVTALSQAGIKYFSVAPNYFDRIGTILKEWENKPFYWLGPDGQTKVLVWIPYYGYAMSHVYGHMSPALLDDFFNRLDQEKYPYDVAYLRWSGHGDNAEPDPEICDFIKDWNAKYAWPKFVISGPTPAFQALEQRYASQIPVVRGDLTPYWEDGAGSSARETALNRQSSDRLVQAETAFALLNPQAYPAADFDAAWKHVLLYSEHTWGAWCSIDQPENPATIEQWAGKKSYADKADAQSRQLLAQALSAGEPAASDAKAAHNDIEVVNTLSWPRTELVTVSPELSAAGDRVTDDRGKPVASQRLHSGELVFLVEKMPPFATRRYTISTGTPYQSGQVTVGKNALDNGRVRVRVQELTGSIVELTDAKIPGNFVDTSSGEAVNDYDYLIGDDLKNLQHNGPVKISPGETGPLVASLVVESAAPGCNQLRRELRVVAGQDYVEVINLVDKARLQAKSYRSDSGKESLNFAFPFNVPEGEMLVDLPLARMQPEQDQMPGACKNWLTVGRWVDISNAKLGITTVTLDAPLIEAGELSARLLNSQTNPEVWRKHINRTQKFYSWAMNNHWGTNYRAYQEGPVTFRFILRPHRKFDPAEASRFATGFSQPLLVRQAPTTSPKSPLLRVSDAGVLVSAFKPSDDGKAWIVRLFGASGKTVTTKLNWGDKTPKAVYVSGTNEKAGASLDGNKVTVPGLGLVTLRAEFE
ncbi:MAG TPA: polysaccharide lyase family protein [Dongiaceae bacterium]|nr:polysaccharide lyase family protein [Dongiaceae bacterium]